MDNLTDEQLVAEYLRGERQALDLLIKRYLAVIYNYALGFVKDRDAAEDLTQETFVKVWKKIKKYNNQYKFKNWLYAVAKNTALDYLRKNKAVNFSALDGEDGWLFEESIKDNSPAPDAGLAALAAAAVKAAVDKLPEKYRHAVSLRYRDGYKFREIAARLKESIETVKSRNRRALIYLKKLINK